MQCLGLSSFFFITLFFILTFNKLFFSSFLLYIFIWFNFFQHCFYLVSIGLIYLLRFLYNLFFVLFPHYFYSFSLCCRWSTLVLSFYQLWSTLNYSNLYERCFINKVWFDWLTDCSHNAFKSKLTRCYHVTSMSPHTSVMKVIITKLCCDWRQTPIHFSKTLFR